ncbi:MAG: hypothetical protein FJ398_14720 [Verrucomicrobia bacterium]|nr:hypothetical protein [Verrucomicrobiota bacterium]
MRRALHILTTPNDPLAETVIDGQRQLPDQEVTVVDCNAREPDYQGLLEEIFRADSIQVW